MELQHLYDRYKNKTLFFCTYNPYKKGKSFQRFQKIGPISDLIRKRSKNYLVVREYNLDGTCHYHAIIDCPAASWNSLATLHKDLVCHVARIGGEGKTPVIPEPGDPTAEELSYSRIRRQVTNELGEYHHLLEPTIKILTNVRLFQMKKARTYQAKNRRIHVNNNLGRVLNYINKDQTMPRMFVDYIYYPLLRKCEVHKEEEKMIPILPTRVPSGDQVSSVFVDPL